MNNDIPNISKLAPDRIKVIDENKEGGGCYITFDDKSLMYFEEADKRMAYKIAQHLFDALESGYQSGLLLGFFNKEMAREELMNRDLLPF